MSFLTPLYVLGALAIAAPIIFHLIRRTPKGEVPFSSLMFLSPTPPRLTRRSRLENWLLLLLRAAALGLLALAFARPFLRQAIRLDSGDTDRRRIAILIDTSASMRRGNLWTRAKAMAREVIDDCQPGDELAVLAFDSNTRPLMGFAESATLDPTRRKAVARASLEHLAPTWSATDLGQALIDAVAAVEDVADASEKGGRMPRRIVLVSDLQRGGNLEALGGFEWPSDVDLELKTVADNDRSNATLQGLDDAGASRPSDTAPSLRVRVTNDPGSRRDQFRLRWGDDGTGEPVEAYVPPGESRVVRVPLPEDSRPRRSLRLEGDDEAFDNMLFLADDGPDEINVVYIGTDASDDPSGLLYYLERAFASTARRSVKVRSNAPAEPLVLGEPRTVPLVVLATETNPGNLGRLQEYVRGGGTVMLVLTSAKQAEALAALTGAPAASVEEADVSRDVMLGEIDFDHPLFAPFAGPQFNDFTKIHFWKYRKFDENALDDAHVPARFETGDPAMVEKYLGDGKVVILASGWSPADSQLARSSKFVPLMAGLLEGDEAAFDATNIVVNEPVPMGAAGDFVVKKPDGTSVEVGADSTVFQGTDQPGVYTIEAPGAARTFAVNLDPAEGKTDPLEIETLEQFGCRLASRAPTEIDPEQARQMRNAELEGRQKIWRWVILAAIAVLIVETLLAGRHAQARAARAEALAT